MKKLFSIKYFVLIYFIQTITCSELEIFRPYSSVVQNMNECGHAEKGSLRRKLILGLKKTDFDLAAKIINDHQKQKVSFDRSLQKLSNSNLVGLANVFDFLDVNHHENINLNNVLKYISRRNLITKINPDLYNIINQLCLDSFKSKQSQYYPAKVFVPKDFTQKEPLHRYNVNSQFSPNNKYLAMHCGAHVVIRDLELDQEIQKIDMFLVANYLDDINMKFSLDSKLLAISDSQKCVVWDLENNQLKLTLNHDQIKKMHFVDNCIITECYNVKCTWSIATGLKFNQENRHQNRYKYDIYLKKQLTDKYFVTQKQPFGNLYFYNSETKFECELKATNVDSINYLGNNRVIFKVHHAIGIYDIVTNQEFLLDFFENGVRGVHQIIVYDDLICIVVGKKILFLKKNIFYNDNINSLQSIFFDRSQSICNQIIELKHSYSYDTLRVSPNGRFFSVRDFQKIFLFELKPKEKSKLKDCFKRILQKLCRRKSIKG